MTVYAPGTSAAYSLFALCCVLVGTEPVFLHRDQLLLWQLLHILVNGCCCLCGFISACTSPNRTFTLAYVCIFPQYLPSMLDK